MVVKQPLYHKQTLATAEVSKTFFTVASTDKLVTNMTAAGQLPDPQSFVIGSLQVFWELMNLYATTLSDISVLFMSKKLGAGIATLTVNGETILELPIWMCSGGGGTFGLLNSPAATATTTEEMALNGMPGAANVFAVDPPITLAPRQSFDVTLKWPTAPFTTLTGAIAPDIWVVLGGRVTK